VEDEFVGVADKGTLMIITRVYLNGESYAEAVRKIEINLTEARLFIRDKLIADYANDHESMTIALIKLGMKYECLPKKTRVIRGR
jgi:hypothetical protein